MGLGWQVTVTDDGVKHVIPIADQRPHTEEDCWCRPTDDEGVLVHHSSDRRELRELANSMTEDDNEPTGRLDEFTKEEWFDVCKKVKPGLTQDQYDKMWDDFQTEKARRKLQ